ncbi:MAG: NFACT RNA binding domain-containing protein [Spirochaetaceae bacterium]|nr:NFACT RNA binding domain-containing protein [Spirochaetaceae bacterium]
MSLNWKEIDLILSELDLAGCQIQKVNQNDFDVLSFKVYGQGGERTLLAVIRSGVCRLHETFRAAPKSDKPLRFGELLKSRIVNGWIEEAVQLGSDRIVRWTIRRGERRYLLYFRLWSNAANVLLCESDGRIIDAMRRLPKRGEAGGGYYRPEQELKAGGAKADRYAVREPGGEGSFNEKIDRWYAEEGASLSLDALRAEAHRRTEGGVSRLEAALARLREKEAEYSGAERLKEYGDIIMASMTANPPAESSGGVTESWIEVEDFYSGGLIRLNVDPKKSPAENAAFYYGQYRKAKSGLADVRAEISSAEAKITRQKEILAELLNETNPLRLQKLLKNGSAAQIAVKNGGRKRPGLAFRRGEWLLIVGRDAKENDELLRRHVKGNDLWLHVRDFAGSYVFIKQRAGKTVPLPVLLDAANLALFYSKGRNAGKGELFYTQVKYLRRAKNGPKGLVIPTQEKNLSVTLEASRLKELEACRDPPAGG